MQLFLTLGIFLAAGAVSFALQNEAPVTVMLSTWRFDSPLAVVLLVALGLGSLIATLASTPKVIEGQWARARLRRQIACAEEDKKDLQRRLRALELEVARLSAEPAASTQAPGSYAVLKSMRLAGEKDPPRAGASAARVMQAAERS